MSALAGTIASPWTVNRGPGAAWWLRSLLSLLVIAGVSIVALPAAFGSGARSTEADPVQVFSSGSLIAAEVSGGADLSMGGMVPGQSRSATLRVANAAATPNYFSLTPRVVDRVGPGGAPLSGVLILRIVSAGSGAPIYSGPLGQMPRLGLGSVPAGAERAYRFTVTLPDSAGNEVEGSSLSAGFAWGVA